MSTTPTQVLVASAEKSPQLFLGFLPPPLDGIGRDVRDARNFGTRPSLGHRASIRHLLLGQERPDVREKLLKPGFTVGPRRRLRRATCRTLLRLRIARQVEPGDATPTVTIAAPEGMELAHHFGDPGPRGLRRISARYALRVRAHYVLDKVPPVRVLQAPAVDPYQGIRVPHETLWSATPPLGARVFHHPPPPDARGAIARAPAPAYSLSIASRLAFATPCVLRRNPEAEA